MNKLVQKNMLQILKQRSSIVSNQVRLMSLMTNSHMQKARVQQMLMGSNGTRFFAARAITVGSSGQFDHLPIRDEISLQMVGEVKMNADLIETIQDLLESYGKLIKFKFFVAE